MKNKETLEEAAEKLFIEQKLNTFTPYDFRDAFKAGAKWQQEQDKKLYSAEEVLEHLNLLYSMKNSMVDTFTNDDDYITMEWFKK
jgi:hypothetical protein